MPRADFYLIGKPRFESDPLLLVCELAKRCFRADKSTLILVRDQDQADLLDGRLWDFEEDAFIPHQIAGADEDDENTPVLIVVPDIDVPDRPYIINLRDAAFRGTCERVLEVVPADPAAREPLRERWRDYKARGFDLHKHDM
ncbi:MAG: DNA polymerase III subunit chi [Xanthomonadaceae bacterium]|nr:DNA polymerase III subunit chi [Xanthomonadaceae bacterium]